MKIEILHESGSEFIDMTKSDKDGWYECKGYAMNPGKSYLQASPWHTDYCEPTTYKFKEVE